MILDKNPIINLNFSKKNSAFNKYYNIITESLYSLFDLILDDPIENFILECIIILLGYSQLIIFIFDPIVSIYKIIIFIL